MAEQKHDKENQRVAAADTGRQKDVGPVEAVVLSAAMGLGKLWNAITADGVLAAAGRQGFDELGAALKAFPESIQREEPGTIFNPTQGEIATDRKKGRYGEASRQPWPSEIAPQNRHLPSKDHGTGHGHDHDAGMSM